MVELRERPVADVMATDVLVLHADATLREAITMLDDEGVSGAPVVDEAGQLVGVFSLSDLARHDAELEEGEGPRGTSYFKLSFTQSIPVATAVHDAERVSDWMSTDVKALPPGATVGDAARLMTDEGIHRVLILDGKAIRGIVSTLDLVALIAAEPERTRDTGPARRAA